MFATEDSNCTRKCNYANMLFNMAQSEEYGSILWSDDSEIALDISSEEKDFSSDESSEVNACFLFCYTWTNITEIGAQSMLNFINISQDALTVNCCCKSKCMRKLKIAASGKITGCPSKNSGLLCGGKCACGTRNKPCKNKPVRSIKHHRFPQLLGSWQWTTDWLFLKATRRVTNQSNFKFITSSYWGWNRQKAQSEWVEHIEVSADVIFLLLF